MHLLRTLVAPIVLVATTIITTSLVLSAVTESDQTDYATPPASPYHRCIRAGQTTIGVNADSEKRFFSRWFSSLSRDPNKRRMMKKVTAEQYYKQLRLSKTSHQDDPEYILYQKYLNYLIENSKEGKKHKKLASSLKPKKRMIV